MSLPRISIDRIKSAVAVEFAVPVREMVSQRKHREVARPRQVAMTLACYLTPCSLPLIGRLFGGRDHTTVIAARRRIDQLRAGDGEFDRRVRRIEDQLRLRAEPPPEIQLTFLIGPLFDRPGLTLNQGRIST